MFRQQAARPCYFSSVLGDTAVYIVQ